MAEPITLLGVSDGKVGKIGAGITLIELAADASGDLARGVNGEAVPATVHLMALGGGFSTILGRTRHNGCIIRVRPIANGILAVLGRGQADVEFSGRYGVPMHLPKPTYFTPAHKTRQFTISPSSRRTLVVPKGRRRA